MSDYKKPINHGTDHAPGGPDPGIPGVVHLIGTTDEPVFENSWAVSVATVEIPVPLPMYFLIVLGRPNRLDLDGETILQYQHKVLEIAGDVEGGADGTTVFTLPPAYRYEHDRPWDGHDNGGTHVACRLFTDGRFVRGVA